MLETGRIVEMLLMIFSIVAIYYNVNQARKGKVITLRNIPALDALGEAVGRAAELGRPVHYTPGYSLGGLYNPMMGPGVMAGLVILQEVAKLCAALGTPIIVTLAQPEAVPIVEDTIKTAYEAQNLVPDPTSVRFISTEQYAYATGVLSILLEERPGASILMGFFWSEALQFAEGGSYIGAMQIGGTNSAGQISFFVASCDYCLIGEELFAAKGYIDKDPSSLGSIAGQDLIRASYIVLILITWISANIGLHQLLNILKM